MPARRRRRPRSREVAVAAERLTVLDVLRRSTTWLGERAADSPRLDAELLVAHALGLDRLQLYLQFDRPLGEVELSAIRELVRRRGAQVPVAYLVGQREFYSLTFQVDERVLVPRPETELLVEIAAARLADHPAPVFADVGTGSGCVAVAVLHEVPAARGHAIDIEGGALEVASANAERHGVLDRLDLHEGDLLAPLRGQADWGRLDAGLSNPPYILQDDPSVERGVREHEPHAALFVAGTDPLVVAMRIAQEALDALAPGGLLAFEVGLGSAEAATARLRELGYVEVTVVPDLAGIDRVISGCRPAKRIGSTT